MTVFDAYNKFLRAKQLRGFSPKTIDSYRCFLPPFIRFVGDSIDISTLNTDIALDYIQTLFTRPLADATRATYVRHLKVFLRWLKEKYNVFFDLTEIVIPKTGKKVVHLLSPDEVMKLFSSVSSKIGWIQLRNYAILSLMLDSGLRQGEIVSLLWCNVDYSRKIALVCGKGKKERYIPLGEFSIDCLSKYRQACPFKSEYVFVGRRGEHITGNAVKLFVQKLRKTSGIDFSSHKLRHNFATNYVIDSLERTGQCDVFTLQALMGHESAKTTEVYLHQATAMVALKNNHSHLDGIMGV